MSETKVLTMAKFLLHEMGTVVTQNCSPHLSLLGHWWSLFRNCLLGS